MSKEVNQEEDIEVITPVLAYQPEGTVPNGNGSRPTGGNGSRRRRCNSRCDGHKVSRCGILVSTREGLINTLSLMFISSINENAKGCIRFTPTGLMKTLCGAHVSPSFISLAHNILEKLYSTGYIQYKFVSKKKYNGKEVTTRAIYLVCSGQMYDAVRKRDLQTLRQILDSVLDSVL